CVCLVASASSNPCFPAARYGLTRVGLTPTDRARFAWRLPSFNPLVGAGELSLPLGPARNEFGPAVVRVRTAKSAFAGAHFLHAHFVGWQTAIVRKEIALTGARAPRHLSGLAGPNVAPHFHRYR